MSTPIVAFFNSRGGTGRTSLVYHLAWMYADLGRRVLTADLDPQARLTAALLDEDRLEEIWGNDQEPLTVSQLVAPLLGGGGEVAAPHCERIADGLSLLVGNPELARFEDELAQQWLLCLEGKERAFLALSAFWRLLRAAARSTRAEVVLLDVGSNLGALDRAALAAADHVIIPLASDLFSLQGLKSLGPCLQRWRSEWAERLGRSPDRSLELPPGRIEPAGYVVLQHTIRLDRPVYAYARWLERIPELYARLVVQGPVPAGGLQADPACLGLIKPYPSLVSLAQEARKPIFDLRAADGALGSNAKAVQDARRDFEKLAINIARHSWDRPAGQVGPAA